MSPASSCLNSTCDATLSGALYLAEDAIDAILAGEFAKPEGAA